MKQGRRPWGLAVSGVALVLAAAGCTGSDVISTGNEGLVIEAVATNQPPVPVDCVQVVLVSLKVRPLDGVCAPTSPLPGAPCFEPDDCNSADAGACVGSNAAQLAVGDGITIIPTPDPIDIVNEGQKKGVVTPNCDPEKRCSSIIVPCFVDADCPSGTGPCLGNPNPGTCEDAPVACFVGADCPNTVGPCHLPAGQCSTPFNGACETDADCLLQTVSGPVQAGTCAGDSGEFPQLFAPVPSPLPSGLYRIHDLQMEVAAYDNDESGVNICQISQGGYTPEQLEFTIVAPAPKTLQFAVNAAALRAALPSNCPDSNQSSIVQIVK